MDVHLQRRKFCLNPCPELVDHYRQPTAEDIQAYDDNGIGPGGWRGKVGLSGLDTGGQGEQVCFDERIVDRSAPKSTAREYRTIRNTSPESSEGINQSFLCHNFLLVDAQGGPSKPGEPDPSCRDGAAEYDGIAKFASMKIERQLSAGEPNTVQSIDSSACLVTFNVEFTVVINNLSEEKIPRLRLIETAGCGDSGYDTEEQKLTYSCQADTTDFPIEVILETRKNNNTQSWKEEFSLTVNLSDEPPTANPEILEFNCESCP